MAAMPVLKRMFTVSSVACASVSESVTLNYNEILVASMMLAEQRHGVHRDNEHRVTMQCRVRQSACSVTAMMSRATISVGLAVAAESWLSHSSAQAVGVCCQ